MAGRLDSPKKVLLFVNSNFNDVRYYDYYGKGVMMSIVSRARKLNMKRTKYIDIVIYIYIYKV